MIARLSLRNVSKSFGAIHALSGVSFDVLPGEVHVVAGENGAGKSTLIKILSGVYEDFGGELLVDGQPSRFANPLAATRAGIATIHQELSLVGSLSVVDNLMFGSGEPAFAPIARAPARRRAETLLSALGLSVDPEASVETFGFAERQLFEIARALGRNARVFVMDEPTSALAEPEAEQLVSSHRRARRDGSERRVHLAPPRRDVPARQSHHRPSRRPARVHAPRRPRSARRARRRHARPRRLAARLPDTGPAPSPRPAPVRTRCSAGAISGSRTASFRDVSFELGAGEILGVAGLEGSGAGALLHALFGASGALEGAALLEGDAYAPSSPRAAFAAGVALVPGDREASVLPALRVIDNATLSGLARYSPYGLVDRERERRDVERAGAELRLRPPSLDAPAATLSGGNQQKLALLRCLLTKPRLLLLDDPTRGVDVGAKTEIHELLRELARENLGIVFRSTELDELFAVADRVMVFYRGRVVETLTGSELTRERVLEGMLGTAA